MATNIYAVRLGRRLVSNCLSFGKEQVMPVVVAAIVAWASVRLGLVSTPQTRAAFEAMVLLPFGIGLAGYVGCQLLWAPIQLWREDRQKRLRELALPSASQIEQRDVLDAAREWLESRLGARNLYVGEAYLYGSVVHDHYPTSDVDVLIAFKAASMKRLRSAGLILREELRREFRQDFQRALHIKVFCAHERDRQAAYMTEAGLCVELKIIN